MYGCVWCDRWFKDYGYYAKHRCKKRGRIDFIGTIVFPPGLWGDMKGGIGTSKPQPGVLESSE